MNDVITTGTMPKIATGIRGFDEITGGGLPKKRSTLVSGGAGSGKTILALQTLVNGARDGGGPGIFVSFEEPADRIRSHASQFGWDVTGLERADRFAVLDARPDPGLMQSGDFELAGLVGALDAQARAIGATRIAIDAIDMVLALSRDPRTVRRELFRLHDWLTERGLTALITTKVSSGASGEAPLPNLDFMQFMVDCSVSLGHELVEGVAQRSLRVLKYRGSDFEGNAIPFLIGVRGIEVASMQPLHRRGEPAGSERVSTGIPQLDGMLDGGYYRGASVLMTGAPGTAKTTLAGAFCASACDRGERAIFVSFDSHAGEIVRNLASVGIDFAPHLETGAMRIASMHAISGSAEGHLMRIRGLAEEHGVRCLVIDPLSALSKRGNAPTARSVVERLVDWAKSRGITLVCTSLLDRATPLDEGTPLEISTIADTWIHLDYHVRAGERNRSLSIIKSRGTGHSNQVRELILGDGGVRLERVYTAGGEVLMGTLRREKERALELAKRDRAVAVLHRRHQLNSEKRDLEARIALLREQLAAKEAEQAVVDTDEQDVEARQATTESLIEEWRGGP